MKRDIDFSKDIFSPKDIVYNGNEYYFVKGVDFAKEKIAIQAIQLSGRKVITWVNAKHLKYIPFRHLSYSEFAEKVKEIK